MLDLWQQTHVTFDCKIELESWMLLELDLNILFLWTDPIRLKVYFTLYFIVDFFLI